MGEGGLTPEEAKKLQLSQRTATSESQAIRKVQTKTNVAIFIETYYTDAVKEIFDFIHKMDTSYVQYEERLTKMDIDVKRSQIKGEDPEDPMVVL